MSLTSHLNPALDDIFRVEEGNSLDEECKFSHSLVQTYNRATHADDNNIGMEEVGCGYCHHHHHHPINIPQKLGKALL